MPNDKQALTEHKPVPRMFEFWVSFGGFALLWSWFLLTFNSSGSTAGLYLACLYAIFAVWGILVVVVPRTLLTRGALTIKQASIRQRIWGCVLAGLVVIPCGSAAVLLRCFDRSGGEPLIFLLVYLGLGLVPLEAAYRTRYPFLCACVASSIPVGHCLVLMR